MGILQEALHYAVRLAITTSLVIGGYLAYRVFIAPHLSHFRDLPGPSFSSYVFGNLGAVATSNSQSAQREWSQKYGRGGVVKYRGFLGRPRVFFTDPASLTYMLVTHSYSFPKPPEALTPLIFEKAYQLRDIWTELVATDQVDTGAFKSKAKLQEFKDTRTDQGEIVLDVMKWVNRLALDLIGLAGFGYNFEALEKKGNLLGDAFCSMLSCAPKKPTAFDVASLELGAKLLYHLPTLATWIPHERIQALTRAFPIIDSETRKIVAAKKLEVAEEGSGASGGKDLMAILLKANTKGGKVEISDADLQGQVTTTIVAGHETTATSLTWTLYRLARCHDVQTKLRTEIREARRTAKEAGQDEISHNELHALPYLDAVVRESLRIESPIPYTLRMVTADDIIPLSTPIRGRSGNMISGVPVKAGDRIDISISAVNFNKDVFGEDADQFRPERWLEAKSPNAGVGVYSGLMTFLAGPRSCIGYTFTISELKA
ncbi:hypothetical protein RQP46_008689 [Phenoliferia psychrophenolica]